jgi:excinuclease ABC subunit B
MTFTLKSRYEPCGDQPRAIKQLCEQLKNGGKRQVLKGVTGSGKTFTMAHVIEKMGSPALILAHNKTLAAQLYQEFKALFPDNAVEYFVSYYDYYQPEAYIARTDTYIEKDLAINEQIERLRLSATRSLVERRDVIIISSVSCIYGLGMPDHYVAMRLTLTCKQLIKRQDLLVKFIEMQYERSEDLSPGFFRVRGEVIEIYPTYEVDKAYRIEMFDDEIEKIRAIDPITGHLIELHESITIYPGSHYVTPPHVREGALASMKAELDQQTEHFEKEGKWLERERLLQRTRYDMEMIQQVGHCKGIENYSRHFDGRKPGQAPSCLLSFFPEDYLVFIDESHQTLPQVHAMYNGDRARKTALVEFGFRLPSAYDNRPLRFEEFDSQIQKVVFVSATPSKWEVSQIQEAMVEQIIRPTGLLDPPIEVKPARYQVDDVIEQIRLEIQKKGKILLTTLTKKMSEELSRYLEEIGVKAKYLHSEIETLERIEIIRDFRAGVFDVLVGINLLREGLDMPEVTLVAILDADKEGFLRSATALIQTCGRAARNSEGRVIMYADRKTGSMNECIEETERRRSIQIAYNEANGIIPKTVQSQSIFEEGIESSLKRVQEAPSPSEKSRKTKSKAVEVSKASLTVSEIEKKIQEYKNVMQKAAKDYRFEEAARYRDLMHEYEKLRVQV